MALAITENIAYNRHRQRISSYRIVSPSGPIANDMHRQVSASPVIAIAAHRLISPSIAIAIAAHRHPSCSYRHRRASPPTAYVKYRIGRHRRVDPNDIYRLISPLLRSPSASPRIASDRAMDSQMWGTASSVAGIGILRLVNPISVTSVEPTKPKRTQQNIHCQCEVCEDECAFTNHTRLSIICTAPQEVTRQQV